eukprot:Skav217931  [mRNA]  locus=scaffold2633:236752:238004:+ [translate_table: standard]
MALFFLKGGDGSLKSFQVESGRVYESLEEIEIERPAKDALSKLSRVALKTLCDQMDIVVPKFDKANREIIAGTILAQFIDIKNRLETKVVGGYVASLDDVPVLRDDEQLDTSSDEDEPLGGVASTEYAEKKLEIVKLNEMGDKKLSTRFRLDGGDARSEFIFHFNYDTKFQEAFEALQDYGVNVSGVGGDGDFLIKSRTLTSSAYSHELISEWMPDDALATLPIELIASYRQKLDGVILLKTQGKDILTLGLRHTPLVKLEELYGILKKPLKGMGNDVAEERVLQAMLLLDPMAEEITVCSQSLQKLEGDYGQFYLNTYAEMFHTEYGSELRFDLKSFQAIVGAEISARKCLASPSEGGDNVQSCIIA